jgi:cytochrome c biogenesis protein CcdA/glutaredoxin
LALNGQRSWSLAAALLAGILVAGASQAADESCKRIDVYSREGCPHCANAKEFLGLLAEERPDLEIVIHDVIQDPGARDRLWQLQAEHAVDAVGVPAFSICDTLIIGFSGARSTGLAIRRAVEMESASESRKVFGAWDVEALGLPAFTIVLGLVDGFNPCAMWVLLILLSVLVGVRDRRKVVAIAGTFVLVSGLAYFVFMAAWLNVFLLIGWSRAVQVVIGVIALVIGVIHAKDFFAFKRGISLSIPESAKPAIYRRIRGIVRADNIPAAMAGAFVLAVLVNILELLCTAGLPAIYTQVLSTRTESTWAYYGYLALYNVAYMFDDAVMVTIAVVTLHRMNLQERHGRWLKALSGAVMLGLGLLLVFRPGWLT